MILQVPYHNANTSTNTNTAAPSLLTTTTYELNNTKKGPRDVNDDVSWTTSTIYNDGGTIPPPPPLHHNQGIKHQNGPRDVNDISWAPGMFL